MSESIADKVARTRREQGLPPKVEDGAALQRIADLFKAVEPPKRKRRRAA